MDIRTVARPADRRKLVMASTTVPAACDGHRAISNSREPQAIVSDTRLSLAQMRTGRDGHLPPHANALQCAHDPAARDSVAIWNGSGRKGCRQGEACALHGHKPIERCVL